MRPIIYIYHWLWLHFWRYIRPRTTKTTHHVENITGILMLPVSTLYDRFQDVRFKPLCIFKGLISPVFYCAKELGSLSLSSFIATMRALKTCNCEKHEITIVFLLGVFTCPFSPSGGDVVGCLCEEHLLVLFYSSSTCVMFVILTITWTHGIE